MHCALAALGQRLVIKVRNIFSVCRRTRRSDVQNRSFSSSAPPIVERESGITPQYTVVCAAMPAGKLRHEVAHAFSGYSRFRTDVRSFRNHRICFCALRNARLGLLSLRDPRHLCNGACSRSGAADGQADVLRPLYSSGSVRTASFVSFGSGDQFDKSARRASAEFSSVSRNTGRSLHGFWRKTTFQGANSEGSRFAAMITSSPIFHSSARPLPASISFIVHSALIGPRRVSTTTNDIVPTSGVRGTPDTRGARVRVYETTLPRKTKSPFPTSAISRSRWKVQAEDGSEWRSPKTVNTSRVIAPRECFRVLVESIFSRLSNSIFPREISARSLLEIAFSDRQIEHVCDLQ